MSKLAGCVQQRKNRQTKTLIGVYHAKEAQIDADDPWVVVCEVHGLMLSVATKALALRDAAHPEEWCEDCEKEVRK